MRNVELNSPTTDLQVGFFVHRSAREIQKSRTRLGERGMSLCGDSPLIVHDDSRPKDARVAVPMLGGDAASGGNSLGSPGEFS